MNAQRIIFLLASSVTGMFLPSCGQLPSRDTTASGTIEIQSILDAPILIDIESVKSDFITANMERITLNYSMVDSQNIRTSARLMLYLEDTFRGIRELPVYAFGGNGNSANLHYTESNVDWFEAYYAVMVTSGNLMIHHFYYENRWLEVEFSLDRGAATSADDEDLTISATGSYRGPVE